MWNVTSYECWYICSVKSVFILSCALSVDLATIKVSCCGIVRPNHCGHAIWM